MMKAPDLRDCDDATSFGRLHLAWERSIALKRAVATRPLMIGNVRAEDALEMSLAEDDHVVEAFLGMRPVNRTPPRWGAAKRSPVVVG
jgi:hypothetical protein